MSLSPNASWPRLLVAGVLGLALLGAAGCKKGRAAVKGKVTFMDQPVTLGTVNFLAPDNRVGQATIDKDGNYTASDAPVGDVKVFVTVPAVPIGPEAKMPEAPPGMGMMSPPEGMGPPAGSALTRVPDPRANMVPPKYRSPADTPLTFTVKRGENTFDIQMTP